jgi:chemotaxis protein methyltransferase CheR
MSQATQQDAEDLTAAPRAPSGSSQLSMADFGRLRGLIHEIAGINLVPAKRVMVETRLRKRVEELGLPSYRAYCDLVMGPHGEQELAPLLDRITTNKTDFFREAVHFDFLTCTALPALAAQHGSGQRQPLAVWSAGCSSGEEPYTLAMVLSEYAETQGPGGYRFSIAATDISTRVLEKARQGIYDAALTEPVPVALKRKYMLRSKDPSRAVVRIGAAIRNTVQFRRLNFMDEQFGFDRPFDVIFCRNVMIYFDEAEQKRLINKFHRCLNPEGYLFVGHAESLFGLTTKFHMIHENNATAYQRIEVSQ